MAKKPIKPLSKSPKSKPSKQSSIICELCEKNQVSKERIDLIGKVICLECAATDNSQTMAVQDCDKDGVVEMGFVDSKTYHTYSKAGKGLLIDD